VTHTNGGELRPRFRGDTVLGGNPTVPTCELLTAFRRKRDARILPSEPVPEKVSSVQRFLTHRLRVSRHSGYLASADEQLTDFNKAFIVLTGRRPAKRVVVRVLVRGCDATPRTPNPYLRVAPAADTLLQPAGIFDGFLTDSFKFGCPEARWAQSEQRAA